MMLSYMMVKQDPTPIVEKKSGRRTSDFSTMVSYKKQQFTLIINGGSVLNGVKVVGKL